MSSTAPVFIVGQARSGSSILYRLVQEHPRFAPAGGLDLTESHFLTVVATEPSLDVPSMRGFGAMDDDQWRAFEREVRWIERRRRLAVRAPNRVLLGSIAAWRALGCAGAARAYIAHAARARGAERLVEKTPQHLPWARHLASVFPDARLLVISRHPVAAYASFRRRAAEDPDATWADISPSTFAARWRGDVRALADLLTDDGRLVRVERYERLVADPDGFQAALFRWLGEAPLEQLPASVAANPRAPASEAPQLFGPVRDLERDWTAHVSEADAAQLEAELAAPMALLGYSPVVRR